jgi:protease PrsW
MSDAPITTRVREQDGRHWRRVFLGGLLLWVASVLVTFWTANATLVPTVILLGSFLVPATFVVYALEHYADEVLTSQRIFITFVYGGVLGVLGASILEAEFLKQPSLATYIGVGLIEEAAKLAALWLIAWHLPRYTRREGIILGAIVGLGFAALENAGYAFNAMLTVEGLSLRNLVETEVLRGVLTPLGHGVWTAILGGVLFATAAPAGRLRVSGPLVGWYLVVALLHGLWDASRGVAVWLTLLLTATPVQWLLIRQGRVPEPTMAQVQVFTVTSWGLLVLDAWAGLAILRRQWRRAQGLSPTGAAVTPPPGTTLG